MSKMVSYKEHSLGDDVIKRYKKERLSLMYSRNEYYNHLEIHFSDAE